jgi:hypothetical protein
MRINARQRTTIQWPHPRRTNKHHNGLIEEVLFCDIEILRTLFFGSVGSRCRHPAEIIALILQTICKVYGRNVGTIRDFSIVLENSKHMTLFFCEYSTLGSFSIAIQIHPSICRGHDERWHGNIWDNHSFDTCSSFEDGTW